MATELDPASERLTARHHVRLDTLIRLRWLAVAGQSCAVVAVHVGMGFSLPLVACLAVIACSAGLNVALRLAYPVNHRIEAKPAGILLACDLVQLAALLYLTGGLDNPFAVLFLAPVMISATALPPRVTAILGALVVACATVLAFSHRPLPWPEPDGLDLPFLYTLGIWIALLLALAFIGAYAWRIAEEGRALSQALAATELILAREQHLSALDGLAAAAAHELGTPLATIALVSKELEHAIGSGEQADDIALLREQVARCREILKKLTSLGEQESPHERIAMRHLLEDIVEPHRSFGVALDVSTGGEGPEPYWQRNPSVLYGLGNLVENAVDFARTRVTVTARWTAERVEVEVVDDGPGFAPDILGRLGEPYVSTRPASRDASAEAGGLGLGFFIAKTLLERSGAQLTLGNVPGPATGAKVLVSWPRARFAAPDARLASAPLVSPTPALS